MGDGLVDYGTPRVVSLVMMHDNFQDNPVVIILEITQCMVEKSNRFHFF